MSADNGIYILHDSQAGTWRVAHAQAIDNLDWYCELREAAMKDNGDTKPYEQYGTVYPSTTAALEAYIINIWGDSKCHTDKMEAVKEAVQKLEDVQYTEYGIQFIEKPLIDVRWPEKG